MRLAWLLIFASSWALADKAGVDPICNDYGKNATVKSQAKALSVLEDEIERARDRHGAPSAARGDRAPGSSVA